MKVYVGLNVGNLTEPLTGRRWDSAEIRLQIARRVARFAAHGLEPGDRVFLLFAYRLEFFVELLAIWQSGACAIPIDSRLTSFELENLARAAQPRFAVIDDATRADLVATLQGAGVRVLETTEISQEEAPPTSGVRLDDDALILFTSGSTGEPKGAVFTHRCLRARWTALASHLPADAFERTLCILPIHLAQGLIFNSLFPWLSGSDLYITPPYRPDLIARLGAMIDEHRITFMSSVPPVWKLALKLAKPPAAGTLRRVHCTSAPLSAAALEDVRRWTATRQVCSAYGLTETCSSVAGLADATGPAEDGLIGEPWGSVIQVLHTNDTTRAPAPEDRCATGEAGYVWVSTPALMKGYFRREDLTAKAVVDGWLMTGDIGILDDRGRLHLRGRERDEINKGGMKIYPSEIDAVVEQFDRASDACAFGMDDAIYGEAVGMAVVLHDPSDQTIRALHAWLKSHLAEHKMPSKWWALNAIPRTPRGKINRAAVKSACQQQPALDLPSIFERGTQI